MIKAASRPAIIDRDSLPRLDAEMRACLPGEDFAAACQILIPSSGTLRGAGSSVYRVEKT